MGATHLSGPVIAGDLGHGEVNGPNKGNVILTQSAILVQNGTIAVSATINIPAGAQISNFHVDVLTAFNSATSATFSAGLTAGGTEYVSGVNVKAAAGRIAATFTAAQLAAMYGVSVLGAAAPTTAPVVVTITPVGATSAGVVVVTMAYIQK